MELHKPCHVCKHSMKLVTRPRTNPLEPELQWECLCGHQEATYGRKEEGEV